MNVKETGILVINGVIMPDPQKLEFQIMDIDAEEGAGRDQKSYMHRARVGTKRKLVCTFPPLPAEKTAKLLQAVVPEFFTLEYPDALLGRKRTSTFYVGDRKAPAYVLGAGASEPNKWLWVNIGFDFIER